jgi:hypothetical protein
MVLPLEHRALDQSGVRDQHVSGITAIQSAAVCIRQLPESSASPVDQAFRSHGLQPAGDLHTSRGGLTEIDKVMLNTTISQPFSGFAHGVAVRDAVKRDSFHGIGSVIDSTNLRELAVDWISGRPHIRTRRVAELRGFRRKDHGLLYRLGCLRVG